MPALFSKIKKALNWVIRKLFGELTADEMKKFGTLGAIFFLVIGVYWMLRSIKDPIFARHVGYANQPIAKMVSLFFVGFAVMFYSKLVDLFKRHTVFYIMCSLYALCFLIISYLLAYPSLTVIPQGTFFSFIPGNVIGWISYVFIESFGSIFPALSWAYVASTTSPEVAKRGYSMIIILTQCGTVLGPASVTKFSGSYGLPIFFAVGAILIMVIPFIVMFYRKVIPQTALDTAADKTTKGGTGFLEGARLLLTRPYLLGIFVVATFYEIVGTLLDFQMGMLSDAAFPAALDDGAAFAWFRGIYGTSIGVISLLFAIFGTSIFMRRFGLKFCLISFPTIIGVAVTAVLGAYLFGVSQPHLLWIFFAAMVTIKGLNYTLNNPTKEVLYLPTSKDVKYKARGWIDAFGARLCKGSGSIVTNALSNSMPMLMIFGSIASMGILGFWMVVAYFISNSFDKLQEEKKILE